MRRWVNLIGRIGTILMVIGLSMVLVYFIPPLGTGSGNGGWRFPPNSFYIPESRVYSPQSGFHITLERNGTLEMYIIDLSGDYILEWLYNANPQDMLNMSTLQSFLDQHTNHVVIHQQLLTADIETEYIPMKVTNLTLILGNPSQTDTVESSWTIDWFQTIAPKPRLLFAIQLIIPSGVILTACWSIYFFRKRETRPVTG